jgi:hypothetical protein
MDGSRDDSGGSDSFRFGFIPVNLTFTLRTGAFVSLEVLLYFEANLLVVTVEARRHLGGIFAMFVGRCGELCGFFRVRLLSAKTHGLLSVSVSQWTLRARSAGAVD